MKPKKSAIISLVFLFDNRGILVGERCTIEEYVKAINLLLVIIWIINKSLEILLFWSSISFGQLLS